MYPIHWQLWSGAALAWGSGGPDPPASSRLTHGICANPKSFWWEQGGTPLVWPQLSSTWNFPDRVMRIPVVCWLRLVFGVEFLVELFVLVNSTSLALQSKDIDLHLAGNSVGNLMAFIAAYEKRCQLQAPVCDSEA